MSLIVDALKRAQEGAARRLPPLSASRSPLPGLAASRDHSGRIWRVIGGLIAVAAVAGVGAWLISGRLVRENPRTPALAPPLLVVETLPPTSTPTPSNPPEATGGPASETAAGARGTANPRSSRAGVPRRIGGRAPATPVPSLSPPAAAQPSVVAPPSPAAAPAVEVHVDRTKQGAEAMAAGLGDQQRGDLARAIEQYRRGIEADPRNPGLFNNLGIALRQSGRVDEAVEAFDAALKLDPKYEKALNNLGVTRYQQGRYEAAIDLFRQAIRVNPSNAESYVNLGVIYLPAGRWDDALAAFQQAMQYDPRSAEAHYNLALLWERRGDRDRAQEHYEKFVELAGTQHADLVARVKEHLRQFERRR